MYFKQLQCDFTRMWVARMYSGQRHTFLTGEAVGIATMHVEQTFVARFLLYSKTTAPLRQLDYDEYSDCVY